MLPVYTADIFKAAYAPQYHNGYGFCHAAETAIVFFCCFNFRKIFCYRIIHHTYIISYFPFFEN